MDGFYLSDGYLAGVFDGEGCICGSRRPSGNHQVHATVHMASERIVRLFHARFGGLVNKRDRTVGGLQMWSWCINNGQGVEFFEWAAKHCLEKCEQAKLVIPLARSAALNVQSHVRPRLSPDEISYKSQIIDKVKALNGARSRKYGKRLNVAQAERSITSEVQAQ